MEKGTLGTILLKESDKTEEWYQQIMKRYIPIHGLNYDVYQKMIRPYSLLNNDLTPFKQELDRWCNPSSDIEPVSLKDEPIAINRIFSKYEFLIGQMLGRGDKFSTLVVGSDEFDEIDIKYRQALRDSIEDKMLLKMEEMMLKSKGAKQADLQQFVEENGGYDVDAIDKKNFKTDAEGFYSKLLEYFYLKYNFDELKALGFGHVLATGKSRIGVVSVSGFPTPVVFNNLHFTSLKSSDEAKIEKGDWWAYTTPITKAQVMDEIGHEFTEEEIDRRIGFSSGYSGLWDVTKGASYDIEPDPFRGRFNLFGHFQTGQHMSMDTNYYRSQSFCWKSYMEFKAYKEVIFLTFMDEFGEMVTEVVSNKFEIPPYAVKKKIESNRYARKSERYEWVDELGVPYYAEKMHIPRRYEVTRYGADLYYNMREVPNQPLNIDDPYGSFELSAKGANFGGLNAEALGLVERAEASQLQYIVLKHLQLREMSKYDGMIKSYDTDMIPDWLVFDDEGNPIFEGADKASVMRFYIRKLGEFWYSGTQGSGGLGQGGRPSPVKAEMTGNFVDIVNMQNMLELLDKEIGLQMLVLPQSEGLITPYSNVEDNMQAIRTGGTVMEHYHIIYNMVWKSVINEWMRQFIQYYKNFFRDNPEIKETKLHYVTISGTREILKIKPEYLDMEDVGVFLHDTKVDEQYRQMMSQFIQPISQNAGEGSEIVSGLVLSLVRGESPEYIHKKIQELARNQQVRAERMDMLRQKMEERMVQREMENREDRQAHEVQLKSMDNQTKLEATAMQVTSFQEDRDTDKSGVDDALENRKAVHDMLMKERDLNIKEKKLQIEREKMKRDSVKKKTNG